MVLNVHKYSIKKRKKITSVKKNWFVLVKI